MYVDSCLLNSLTKIIFLMFPKRHPSFMYLFHLLYLFWGIDTFMVCEKRHVCEQTISWFKSWYSFSPFSPPVHEWFKIVGKSTPQTQRKPNLQKNDYFTVIILVSSSAKNISFYTYIYTSFEFCIH